MQIDNIPRIDHVALGFGHFLTLAVEDQAQADHIPENLAFKEQGADGMQRVKPPAGLVDGFTDKIGWKLLLEDRLVFKWVMPLSDGHGA